MNTNFGFEQLKACAGFAPTGGYSDLRVVQSQHAAERKQYRFPRSKKRRIRAKWSKRESNYKYIPKMFRLGDMIIAHPVLYARLMADPVMRHHTGEVRDPAT